MNFKKELRKLLDKLGVKKQSNIMIHSNSAGLLQFVKKKYGYDLFFKILTERTGSKGSLVVPTYNYDFTKGIPFNKGKSKSQVGDFTNYLLNKYPKKRTNEPIFSHLVFGKLFNKLNNCKIDEVFGKNSFFASIEKYRFKILCFCCSPAQITFLHYIEKKLNVTYRFDKNFYGSIKIKKKNKPLKLKYYVGKKSFNYSLKENNLLMFLNKPNFIEEPFGRFLCYSTNTKYLENIVKKNLKKNQYFLIEK